MKRLSDGRSLLLLWGEGGRFPLRCAQEKWKKIEERHYCGGRKLQKTDESGTGCSLCIFLLGLVGGKCEA